jgi:hypothetical protein
MLELRAKTQLPAIDLQSRGDSQMSRITQAWRVRALVEAAALACGSSTGARHARPHLRRRVRAAALPAALALLGGTAQAVPVSWVPDADGFWSTLANWSGGVLPGLNDAVTISVGGPLVRNITYNSGASTIASLLSDENLIFSGGALTVSGAYTNTSDTRLAVGGSLFLNGASTLNTLTMSGGTFGGSGNVTVTGLANITGGTMFGVVTVNDSPPPAVLTAGRTILAGGGSISGGGIGLDDGRVLQIGTSNLADPISTVAWSAGTIALNPSGNNAGGGLGNQQGVLATTSRGVLSTSFDGSITTTNYGNGQDIGNNARFDNAGTFAKLAGTGTTTVGVLFNNSGVVDIQSGSINFSGGGADVGGRYQGAGTLVFGGGTHTLDAASTIVTTNVTASGGTTTVGGLYNISSSGTTLVNGGTLNLAGTVTSLGTLVQVSSGSLGLNALTASVPTLTQSGGAIFGSGTLTVTGTATLTGGNQFGVVTVNGSPPPAVLTAGRTILAGGGSIAGSIGFDDGRVLQIGTSVLSDPISTVAWSAGTIALNPSGNNAGGGLGNQQGVLATTSRGVLSTSFDGSITTTNYGNGQDIGNNARFDNAGLFRKTAGTGTTSVAVTYNNTGTTEVDSGTLSFASVVQQSGTTLTGGTWIANNATLTFANGSNILTNQGDLTLSGAASVFARINTLNNNQGSLSVLGGRSFTTAGALTNSGTITAGSGSTISFADAVANTGLLLASGTMSATAAVTGTGTLQVNPGGQFNFAAASTVGTLIDNGSTASALNLGANNVTVSLDYQNVSFGSGDAFNRHANVAGSGQIRSSNANAAQQQGLGGNLLGGATTGNATMAFGNIHVGDTVTLNYQVGNAAGGPALRGAIQTGVNGGSLNDARLTGSGVLASSFGAIAAGSSTGNLAVTFTGLSAGPLSGQQVHVLNNFDNTNSQNLAFTGTAYNLASVAGGGIAPSPVTLANQRVGDGLTQALTVTNTAPAGIYTETLTLGLSGTTGSATFAGLAISGLAGGASDSTSMRVGVDSSLAGLRSGTVVFNAASDGAGSSGLGITSLGTATLNVSGAVFNPAVAAVISPANPVVLANQHIGGAALQTLAISNVAPAGSFTERLDASFGSLAGSALTNGASISLLGAGAPANTAMAVGIDTSSAGAKSGTAQVVFLSDGSGTSGLASISAGTQSVTVQGNVYRYADPGTIGTIALGNIRVGGVATQALAIANNAAADGFSEKLNASFSSVAAGLTSSGAVNLLAAGATDSSSMVVGLDSASAGSKNGSVSVSYISDGNGTSGLGTTPLTGASFNVTGAVFNPAAASSIAPASPIVLANQHVGGSARQALMIANVAPAGSFTEGLDASFGTLSGQALTNGAIISLLAAGAPASTALAVGVDTSSAGARSGTVAVDFKSNGSGSSGLASISVGTQTVTVQGNVYRYASPGALPTIDLGNARTSQAATRAVVIANTAAADGFSEKLDASFLSASGGIATSGSVSLLAAGASDSTSMTVSLAPGNAGTISGTVVVGFTSNGSGSSGLGTTALDSVSFQVSGGFYNAALAAPISPASPIVLPNQHVGGGALQALSILNAAPAGPFTEKLDASFGALSGDALGNGASVSLLAAGAPANTDMAVGVNTGTAGAKNGTVRIDFTSNGEGTSRLPSISAGSQTLAVQGAVYRYAAPGALNDIALGNVRVGGSLTQGVTVANLAAADGYSEKLNASFATVAAGLTASGTISLLAPGSSTSSALVVGLDTGTAGAKGGSVSVAFVSDGSGTSGLGTTALAAAGFNVSGAVFNAAAAAAIAPASPIVLAPQRVGGTATQALSIVNSAPAGAFTERLDASFASLSGDALNNGASVSLLAAGAPASTALAVGVNTATAGAKSGTVQVVFQSNGSDTSGLAPISAGAQVVAVQGDVYRLASPQLLTPAVTLAARVGDVAPSAFVGLTNVSPDAYTERLKAGWSGSPAGFATGGSVGGLAAGATSSGDLSVALNTASAGSFSGGATLAFASSGAGTTGLPDAALGGASVALTGRVYTPAVVQLNTPVADFGIVHRGDVVPAIKVSVGNAAPVAAPNDVLRGSLGGASGPFTASGTLYGVAAQGTDASSLGVTLDTQASGRFLGTAVLSASSENPDLAPLNLAPTTVNLAAQVNEYAQATLLKTAGDGSLGGTGAVLTLDFGTLVIGDATRHTSLSLLNSAAGFADLLRGSFDLSGVSGPFATGGFASFDGLAAGDALSGLEISFAADAEGSFQASIVLHPVGFNASGFAGALADQTLVLRGAVAAVPEPATYALWLGGLLAMLAALRKSAAPAAAAGRASAIRRPCRSA